MGALYYIKWSARKGVESDLAQDVGLVNSMINFQVSQNAWNISASWMDTKSFEKDFAVWGYKQKVTVIRYCDMLVQ
jgi:hypothetical protein